MLPARFLKFCVVGASGVAVDMAFFWLFGAPLGLPLLVAKTLSTELAIVNNFWWNETWTFADVTGGAPGRLRRFALFNAICAGGLLISLGLLSLQVHGLGLDRYLANLACVGVVTAWNYSLNRAFSFRALTPAALEAVQSSG